MIVATRPIVLLVRNAGVSPQTPGLVRDAGAGPHRRVSPQTAGRPSFLGEQVGGGQPTQGPGWHQRRGGGDDCAGDDRGAGDDVEAWR